MLKSMFKKHRKNINTTLKPTNIVGIKAEKDNKWFIIVLLSLLVTAAVICVVKMLIDSFLLFGIKSAEPIDFPYGLFIAKKTVRKFYSAVAIGCLLICAANSLPRHSAKAIISLLALYAAWFGFHYRYVVNGFIRAVNKAVYAVYSVKGQTPTRYYLDYFVKNDANEELFYFLFAVIFAFCFLLAYVGVRRCNALWFTLLVMGCTAIPLSFNCLEGESVFIFLAVICILIYTASVQGYKRSTKKSRIVNVGSTLKVGGKYAAQPAFEQTLMMIGAAILSVLIINTANDFSDYKQNARAQELGRDITYTIESISNGTFLDSIGKGTTGGLKNGQLSRSGDLQYTGDVMFEIKSSVPTSLYLRSYSGATYTGKRWETVRGSVLRSYDFWEDFQNAGFYPQFAFPYNSDYSVNVNDDMKAELEIRNREINHKTFLTDYRMLPAFSKNAIDDSTYHYDGNFTFSAFGGRDRYKETVMSDQVGFFGCDYIGEIPEGNVAESLYQILNNGSFESLTYSSTYFNDLSEDSIEEINSLNKEYSEFLERESSYRRYVSENYLSYPDDLGDYLPEDFDKAFDEMYANSIQRIDDGRSALAVSIYYYQAMAYVRSYIQSNAEYTLTPGSAPRGRDFVDYFLNENHKGYCVHFATSAALMLRRAGIPTRYCEGYYVGDGDFNSINAKGYAEIPDSRAHAWVEVYYPLVGWVATEFTPGYSDGIIPEENNMGKKTNETSSDKEESDEDDIESDTETETDSDTETDTQTDSDSDSETDSEVTEPITFERDTSGSGSAKRPSRIMKAILSVLKFLAIVALIAAAWLGVRLLVCRIRLFIFSRSDTKKAAIAMYAYALIILRLMDVRKKNDEGEEAFAARASKYIGGKEAPQFKAFVGTVLSARFGRTPPKSEDIAEMMECIKMLLSKMYAAKPVWKRLVIKYIMFFD